MFVSISLYLEFLAIEVIKEFLVKYGNLFFSKTATLTPAVAMYGQHIPMAWCLKSTSQLIVGTYKCEFQ